MPQGYGKPRQDTRPTPYRMRQDLGYIPARAMAEGDGGGGITSTGGPTAPILTLTPIADGTFLGNLTGATAIPGPVNFTFLNLRDTPASYAGQALKVVRVNAAATALEFHAEAFIDLTDVPNTYAGSSLKVPRVNAGATALEFVTQNAITSTTLTVTGAGTAAVTIELPNVVAAGSFTNANITIDTKGRVTAAANGTGGGGGGLMPLVNGDTDSVPRETLAANRTYFVATTGSDSNDGLTLATALLTGQAAVNKAFALDLNTFTVTVQFSNGTYSGAITIPNGMWPTGKLVLQGDTVTPANVVISGTSLFGVISAIGYTAAVHVAGFKFTGSGNTAFLLGQNGGTVFYGQCEFSTGASFHLYGNAGICQVENPCTISGGGSAHARADVGGQVHMNKAGGINYTVTGTPAFTQGFVYVLIGGLLTANNATFTGAATGPNYDVEGNGVVFTNGGSPTFFPGSTAGVALTGGQYI